MTAYRPDAYAIFDLMEMSEYANPDTDYQAEAEHLAGLYRDLPEPIPLWRVVRCDSEQQCDLEMPGYHWSFDRDAVIAYAERDLGSPVYLLSAQVSSADVYWEGTVASYVEHPEEYEITPFDDSKLQNLLVETRVAAVSTPGLWYRGRQYIALSPPEKDYIPSETEVLDYFYNHDDSLWGYAIDLNHQMVTELKEEGLSEEEAQQQAFDDKWNEWVEDEIRRLYKAVVQKLNNIDGTDCWRAISLAKGTDPTKVDPLGIYWADEELYAEPHEGTSDDYHVYHAKVNVDGISKYETVMLRSDVISEQEQEIRFKPGTELFVYDVAQYRYPQNAPSVPINDWRRC